MHEHQVHVLPVLVDQDFLYQAQQRIPAEALIPISRNQPLDAFDLLADVLRISLGHDVQERCGSVLFVLLRIDPVPDSDESHVIRKSLCSAISESQCR